MKKVISLSGGLDSTILLYKLAHEFGPENVVAINYFYNQKHFIELECASTTCGKLGVQKKVVDIGFLGDMVKGASALISDSDIKMPTIKEILGHPQPVSYVPFRNLILLSLTLSFAEANGADEVYLANQQQDMYAYWDTSQDFIDSVNNICNLNRLHNISLVAPFTHMSKADEIKLGLELGVPFEDTWTCYTGPDKDGRACGKCPSCAERIKAFMQNGIKDPIPYAIEIPW